MGVDTGSQHIGVGIVSDEKSLEKVEVALRSTMEKRALIEKRKAFRRNRRYRKTRYRHPKFRPHTKRTYQEKLLTRNKHKTHWKKDTITFTSNRKKGWLPPSMQSKLNIHIQWIDRYLSVLPKNTSLRIEVGRFDIAHMKDPAIRGELYQHGPMYEQENVNAYVFDRDRYTCKVCKAKAGSKRKDGSVVKIRAHHIDYKSQGATDNPERMVTVCDACHTTKAHQKGGVLYQWMQEGKKFKRGYRDATMMNIIRVRLMKYYPEAEFTYGNFTAADRKAMHLPKSHANDAVAIASKGKPVRMCVTTTFYKQVRKKKRSLHEANPRKGKDTPNRTAKRNEKNTKAVGNIHLCDTVKFQGKRCHVSGFTGTSVYLLDENGRYVIKQKCSYKQVPISQISLISRNNNWVQYTRKE